MCITDGSRSGGENAGVSASDQRTVDSGLARFERPFPAARPDAARRTLLELPDEPPVDIAEGPPARCHLRLSEGNTGLATLLTGLALLARRGRAQLSWEWVPSPRPLESGPWHLRDKAGTSAELIVDGRHSVYLDIHDSFELDAKALASHDVYFKRSLRLDVPIAPSRASMRAMGLVNHVHPDGFDGEEARRLLSRPEPLQARVAALLRAVTAMTAAALGAGGRPTLSLISGPPSRTRDPRVLFMAGLWDPALVPDAAPDKIAEFEAVNEMRAECVRVLRREFGPRFHGGVQHSEFARRNFPDVLLERGADGGKRAFLQLVRDNAICVTTTGLHGSNGWKLVEYVGLSRAIVSEPLRYVVPGDFAAGRHYLDFGSPEVCAEQVARLMQDHDEREAMMEANQRYAREWMHPERLAWRVIRAAREKR